jgi:hypothetical protein
MKTLRAILIGTGIWCLGVGAYVLSFFIPLMGNAEKQANLVLFLAVAPLVWFGAKRYYKEEQETHGLLIGLRFFLTAAVLDALITVPFLVIPNGGSHAEFFTDPGFWVIALEFLAVALLFYRTRVYSKAPETY